MEITHCCGHSHDGLMLEYKLTLHNSGVCLCVMMMVMAASTGDNRTKVKRKP